MGNSKTDDELEIQRTNREADVVSFRILGFRDPRVDPILRKAEYWL
jgi:hypothetical protein